VSRNWQIVNNADLKEHQVFTGSVSVNVLLPRKTFLFLKLTLKNHLNSYPI